MERGAILDAVRAQKRSGVRRVASDALFVAAGASVGFEIISLFRGRAKKFAKIAIGVALAGEAVAYAYDRIHKPTPEQLIAATYHNTQAVLDSATYGTDVILDPEQNPVHPGPSDTRFPYHAIKRGFDVAFSSAVVALGAVPMALMCAAISVDTPGAPIFFNDRVGRYGLPLRIFKLRTMIEDAEDLDKYLTEAQRRQWHAEHKVDGDPRVTSVGSFLRRTSLDEMPQFLNVLLGQMSVIGPRPVEPDELEAYGKSVTEFLSVTPGITGWWQVKARNNACYDGGRRQALELEYVRDRSLSRDAEIFVETFGAMFGKHKSGR
jgi:lipopolysaccharide/colanic/teichoic acid biosynthesis glycosyltransferase